MRSLFVTILTLWAISLWGQTSPNSYSLRLATTLSAKNGIRPDYPTRPSASHYSESALSFEATVLYRYTSTKFRVTAGVKSGGYAIDNRLNIPAEQSLSGSEYAPRPLFINQFYLGGETSVEWRIAMNSKTSFYIGPMMQMLHAPSGIVEFGHVFLDQKGHIQDNYSSLLITNTARRPYFFGGGKVSTEFRLAERFGLGLSVGYLYSRRDLVESGQYTLYTVDGPLRGTISKPFRYLYVGVELLLLPKKRT